MLRQEKGVTLISLVITIIVMLILAGVTISMVLGENGVLTQATKAKSAQAEASVEEQLQQAMTAAISQFYQDQYVDTSVAGGTTNLAEQLAAYMVTGNGKTVFTNSLPTNYGKTDGTNFSIALDSDTTKATVKIVVDGDTNDASKGTTYTATFDGTNQSVTITGSEVGDKIG